MARHTHSGGNYSSAMLPALSPSLFSPDCDAYTQVFRRAYVSPNHKIIKAALPDMRFLARILPWPRLAHVTAPPTPDKILREALFDHLHHHRRISSLELTDQQMKRA
jgi:hypothetical protein